MFVLFCSFMKKKNWHDLAVVFLPSVMPLSTMLWFRVVMYPERGTIAQMYREQDTFDFSQGHVAKNQPIAVSV